MTQKSHKMFVRIETENIGTLDEEHDLLYLFSTPYGQVNFCSHCKQLATNREDNIVFINVRQLIYELILQEKI